MLKKSKLYLLVLFILSPTVCGVRFFLSVVESSHQHKQETSFAQIDASHTHLTRTFDLNLVTVNYSLRICGVGGGPHEALLKK